MSTVAETDLDFTPRRVRAIRVRLGLDQAAFAAKLGVSINTVSRWETGQGVPLRAKALGGLLSAEREAEAAA